VIESAVRQAIGRRRPERLLVANLGYEPAPSFLPAFLRRRSRWACTTEWASALAMVGESHGVVVIAGTGATVGCRTRDGRELRLDGLGPVLGDTGSGYQIGWMALRAAARAQQNPRHETRLRPRVFNACGAETLGQLVEFSLRTHDRSVIASLARIVDEEANAGDRIAREILRTAAAGLAGTVGDLIDCLGIARERYALVGAGGVAMHSDIYWREVCRKVLRKARHFKPIRATLPPVVGIVVQALNDKAAAARLLAAMKRRHPS
jgi:N-acetylglucosamine kinase-like BadF-type ATPase